MIVAKLIRDHEEDCRALASCKRGEWTTPWFTEGNIRWLSIAGDRRGSHVRWLVLRCAASNCLGECIVRETDICEQIVL